MRILPLLALVLLLFVLGSAPTRAKTPLSVQFGASCSTQGTTCSKVSVLVMFATSINKKKIARVCVGAKCRAVALIGDKGASVVATTVVPGVGPYQCGSKVPLKAIYYNIKGRRQVAKASVKMNCQKPSK